MPMLAGLDHTPDVWVRSRVAGSIISPAVSNHDAVRAASNDA